MARTESQHLKNEKQLPHPIKPHNVRLCPSMDLVAVASSDQQIEVFRLNGQRAFIHRRVASSTTVTRICWELDGQHILVAWSDGIIESVRTQDGKTVSKTLGNRPRVSLSKDKPAQPSPTIEALHHGLIVIEPNRVKGDPLSVSKLSSRVKIEGAVDRAINTWDKADHDDSSSLDSFLSIGSDAAVNNVADLPRKLSLMDVEDQLPRLPPLPPVEDRSIPILTDPDMFSSQEKMFTQKTTLSTDNNLVNLRFSGWADGYLNIHGQDDFYFGDFQLAIPPHITPAFASSIQSKRKEQRIADIASHPFSFVTSILLEVPLSGTGSDQNVGVALASTGLSGIKRSNHFLPMVQDKVTTLKNCATYIAHAVASLRTTWMASQDLPSRFIENVSEMLEEEKRYDIVTSMYHLAVTGDCSPTIKEWLTAQLSERNQKRWDQAITHGYSRILEVTHESLLPALDRCSVVLSRLRVLSKTPGIPAFSINANVLSETLEILDNIRLLAHTVIQHANRELRQFRVFISWLLNQIQLQSATTGSTAAEEAADKAAAVDHAQLLHYIVGAMTKSRLSLLLGEKSTTIQKIIDGSSPIERDALVKILKLHDQECIVPRFDMPNQSGPDQPYHASLLYQTLRLSNSFTGISNTISCNIREAHEVSYGPLLEPGDCSGLADARMVSETVQGQELMSTYVVIGSKSCSNTINIHRITWQAAQPEDAISSHTATYSSHQSSTLSLPEGRHITDAKFLDDDLLAIMFRDYKKKSTAIVQLPYSFRAATCPEEATTPAFEGVTNLAPNWSTIQQHPQPSLVPNWSSSPQKSKTSASPKTPVMSVPDIPSNSPLRLASFEHPRGREKGDFVPGSLDIRRRGEGWVAVVLDEEGRRYSVLTGD